MQIINKPLNYLQKPVLNLILKLSLFGFSSFFILQKLDERSEVLSIQSFPDRFANIFILVCFMMIANWSLEALRWKVSSPDSQRRSFKNALEVVLAGLALNWVLPFTSGDFLSRLSQEVDKYAAVSAVLLNRAVMLCLTLLLGVYSLGNSIVVDSRLLLFILLIFSFISLLYLFKNRIRRFLKYFKDLSNAALINLLALSILRYLVFFAQFYLMLSVFNPDLSSSILVSGIGVIYLSKTFLPLIAGGLGVREASGLLFFQPHVDELAMIIIPIFLIWIVNVVFPSLVGLGFIWRLKLSSDNKD
ncbi:MAG: flippase-like domain-containing protein [Ekhidna sp.]|nr:flippase-like domain-containing protein [Ekhidna sp.]